MRLEGCGGLEMETITKKHPIWRRFCLSSKVSKQSYIHSFMAFPFAEIDEVILHISYITWGLFGCLQVTASVICKRKIILQL